MLGNHNQSHPPSSGWMPYEAERASSRSWLARLLGVDQMPAHYDEKRIRRHVLGPDLRSHLKGFKRSVMRRLPSMEGGRRAPRSLSGDGSMASASTVRFVLLCSLWYTTSALSSNTGKSIMTLFRYPVTLTFVQFGFVAAYCLLFMSPLVRFSKIRRPTRAILRTTLPMGVFQVGGHIFSSMAISRIPVSTVHTIKALSPLFTVAAYALLFGVSYSAKTYISLVPLTLGVMLACSSHMDASNAFGLLCAFGSAIVFVSSNIFFKKVMPSKGQTSHKLDKLNLLLYSSSMAFVLMIPIWMYYDLPALLSAQANPTHVAHPTHGHATPHSVTYYFIANGTVHFAQNIIAFIILSSTSPVTYSIASLIKRVAVICIAIVWFSQSVLPIQAFGIGLTFLGLYMYNLAKGDVEKGEHKMRRVEAAREFMLPTTKSELVTPAGSDDESADVPLPTSGAEATMTSVYGRPRAQSYALAPNPALGPPPRPRLSVAPPISTYTLPPSYSQSHPHGNLHIKITPPSAVVAPSPLDSYPSPPPSLDSPPSSPPHDNTANAPWRRGTMVAGHGVPHHSLEQARRASVAVA